MRAVLLVIGGWLLAAGVAALLGVLAVYLLGSGITADTGQPLNAGEVERALAQPGTPTTPSPPPPSPTSGGDGQSQDNAQSQDRLQVVETSGGTIIARCRESKTALVSWTPRQGFEADEEVRGPDDAVYLEFSSDDVKVHVTIGCTDDTLLPLVVTGEDD